MSDYGAEYLEPQKDSVPWVHGEYHLCERQVTAFSPARTLLPASANSAMFINPTVQLPTRSSVVRQRGHGDALRLVDERAIPAKTLCATGAVTADGRRFLGLPTARGRAQHHGVSA
jgi:hypothetical protein